MTTPFPTPRIAAYLRVSSDDQRDRQTIQTQRDEVARYLSQGPPHTFVTQLEDDGVSGTIPLEKRPAGRQLIALAKSGGFNELLVYKVDRLGRDALDVMGVRRLLDALNIRLLTVAEGEPDPLGFDVQAVVADHNRRELLARSTHGMNRAAREGRYTGGIVPFGYIVDGRQQTARLVRDETPLSGDLSAAGWVRWMYERLAVDRWSCRKVASTLNDLGVPTSYVRAGRGVRGRRTRGEWRAGRIRNLVTNPVYRGELTYGRRTSKLGRERITANIPRIVEPAMWTAAQDTLALNRVIAKNTGRIYLLRGVIRCSHCGLTYCGSRGRDDVAWYRCNGQIADRGSQLGRCRGRSIRSDAIEPAVWDDIERYLRDPGDLLDELRSELESDSPRASIDHETRAIRERLDELAVEKARAIRFAVKGTLSETEVEPELRRIDDERTRLEARLGALEATTAAEPTTVASDILLGLRERLSGLTDGQRSEIVRLLVGSIVIQADSADTRSAVRAVVSYRFPAVVKTRTGTGSSPPRT